MYKHLVFLSFCSLVSLNAHAMDPYALDTGMGGGGGRDWDVVDPPIKPDPLGNAIVSGAVAGAINGAAAAVGAFARSLATGVAVEAAKEARE